MELSKVPIDGENGKEMRENKCAALAAMKTPALKGGGFGYVQNEEDFDKLVLAMKDELVNTEGASVQTYMLYAQKPAGPRTSA